MLKTLVGCKWNQIWTSVNIFVSNRVFVLYVQYVYRCVCVCVRVHVIFKYNQNKILNDFV